MKTDIKNIAALVATAIWADGEYDEAEKIAVEEIAEAFELDNAVFSAQVEEELKAVEAMSEEEVSNYITEHAGKVAKEESEYLLQAVLQVVIVDGILGAEEIENVMSIAASLGVNETRAILMLADLVKEEPELEIEL